MQLRKDAVNHTTACSGPFIEGHIGGYLEAMKKPSMYGDHITLQALATWYNAQVLVLSNQGQGQGKTNTIQEQESEKDEQNVQEQEEGVQILQGEVQREFLLREMQMKIMMCLEEDPSCCFTLQHVNPFFMVVVQELPLPWFHTAEHVLVDVPDPVSLRRLYMAAG